MSMDSSYKVALFFMILEAAMVANFVSGTKGKEMEEAFNHFDLDRDGAITEKDIILLQKPENIKNIPLNGHSADDLWSGMRFYIRLHGGKISLAEFTDLITNGKSLSDYRITRERLLEAGLKDEEEYTYAEITSALNINDYEPKANEPKMTIGALLEQLNQPE